MEAYVAKITCGSFPLVGHHRIAPTELVWPNRVTLASQVMFGSEVVITYPSVFVHASRVHIRAVLSSEHDAKKDLSLLNLT